MTKRTSRGLTKNRSFEKFITLFLRKALHTSMYHSTNKPHSLVSRIPWVNYLSIREKTVETSTRIFMCSKRTNTTSLTLTRSVKEVSAAKVVDSVALRIIRIVPGVRLGGLSCPSTHKTTHIRYSSIKPIQGCPAKMLQDLIAGMWVGYLRRHPLLLTLTQFITK